MRKAQRRHRFMVRDIDEELVWALHCENPSLERVRELLTQGADVNASDEVIGNALAHAVGDRRVPKEIVKFLVERGAGVTAVNGKGDSVIILAVSNRRLEKETVELLVSRGADVNAVNNHGFSVLASAVSFGCQPIDIIKCLIALGADINAVDKNGYSVLRHATASGREDTIELLELLIERGVRIGPEDEGLPYAACLYGGPEVVAFLLNEGLKPSPIFGLGVPVLDTVRRFHSRQRANSVAAERGNKG